MGAKVDLVSITHHSARAVRQFFLKNEVGLDVHSLCDCCSLDLRSRRYDAMEEHGLFINGHDNVAMVWPVPPVPSVPPFGRTLTAFVVGHVTLTCQVDILLLNWYWSNLSVPTQEVNPYLAIGAKLPADKGVDGGAFYQSLKAVLASRGLAWKQAAEQTGVSASTLARMAQGRHPDAASLAALSAWAGLNPSDFVTASFKAPQGEAIGQISSLLRNDPNLDAEAADALDAIVRTAYEQLRRADG
jgi:transcriptional regulator with XRE-family HTH domain